MRVERQERDGGGHEIWCWLDDGIVLVSEYDAEGNWVLETVGHYDDDGDEEED